MAHVAEWKKEVNELKSLIDKYDVIGIVDLLKHTCKTASRNEEISS